MKLKIIVGPFSVHCPLSPKATETKQVLYEIQDGGLSPGSACRQHNRYNRQNGARTVFVIMCAATGTRAADIELLLPRRRNSEIKTRPPLYDMQQTAFLASDCRHGFILKVAGYCIVLVKYVMQTSESDLTYNFWRIG